MSGDQIDGRVARQEEQRGFFSHKELLLNLSSEIGGISRSRWSFEVVFFFILLSSFFLFYFLFFIFLEMESSEKFDMLEECESRGSEYEGRRKRKGGRGNRGGILVPVVVSFMVQVFFFLSICTYVLLCSHLHGVLGFFWW